MKQVAPDAAHMITDRDLSKLYNQIYQEPITPRKVATVLNVYIEQQEGEFGQVLKAQFGGEMFSFEYSKSPKFFFETFVLKAA